MTESELAEIEARASKASKGRWRFVQGDRGYRSYVEAHLCVCEAFHSNKDANAAFIAAARTDVPLLCQALREAWAEIERLRGGQS